MATLDERIIIDSHTGHEKIVTSEIKRLGINLLAIASTMRVGALMPLYYYPEVNEQLVLTKNSSNNYSVCMVHPNDLRNKMLYASFMLA